MMQTWALTCFAVATLVLLGTGASAFWSGSASGSGSADTAGSEPVSLAPGRPATALSPGASADVVTTVSNPNSVSLRIGSLTLDTDQGTDGFSVDPGHASCGVSALSFSTQSNGGAGWTVPGRVGGVAGTASVTLTDAVGLDADAADACQGATFFVYLAAGP